MCHRTLVSAALAAAALAFDASSGIAAPPSMSRKTVDDAGFSPDRSRQRAYPDLVKAEVLLARAHVSPGAIDGIDGDNFRKALGAYQRQMSLDPSGTLDKPTWDRLASDTAPALADYTITARDAKGPFTRSIPADFEAQSRLKRLGYHDLREALAERFHMSLTLLMALNPGSRFRPGETLSVARVDEGQLSDKGKVADKAARVVVDKTGRDVEALAADGRLLAFFPASIGSPEKPAPTGQFEIRRVVHHPDYTYSPRFHFKGVASQQAFTIPPGPNNPVGTVWIDLSYDGYGIHGTPNPEAIGKTQSHGCIRLTNWDAEALAALVDKGVAVSFGDAPGSNGPVAPSPVAAGSTAIPTAAAPAALARPAGGADPASGVAR